MYLVSLWFTELKHLFLKESLLLYSSTYYLETRFWFNWPLYVSFILQPHWLRLIEKVEVDRGSYSNNLIISTMYWLKKSLLLRLLNKPVFIHWVRPQLKFTSLLFTKPVSYLLFSFQNKPFNLLMIYFMTWLLTSYSPYQVTFYLPYGFILWHTNLMNLTLLNKDYIRLLRV